MHILDAFESQRTTFSFEFFPPRTAEAADDLFRNIADLEALRPTFVSVTYGAGGGSARDLTENLVVRLKDETGLNPMPHLTCVGLDEGRVRAMLERYAAHGISNILALRGDHPNGTPAGSGAFRYAAELVACIKRFNESRAHRDPRGFGIAVAGFPEGHPETPNRLLELDYLKAKVDAGADYVITQLFFDNRDFYDFRDRCLLAGIRVPIIAGIMPITSVGGMKRMAELALGSRFPAPLIRAINRTGGDPEAVKRVGVHWATEQCRDLLDHNVAGIHFYTLNKSRATRDIYATLGVKDSDALRQNGDTPPGT
ncbi:MAG: methylenetetrahydrofolate reductase [NAD(P)H] [Leptolyngbya sp. PLA2]|nr:methylenetetrahydrofolate reductase [NAD(P)H] [Leptolyngbya sp.]MCE7972182.1 methylenetetrahydrofolate reductase [NAD(P)H] [Leptolyngbya sp. PL-A2]MCQ3941241.1 methylenetetrahydrofolate reductase [NAD(P)H] [cyanobacterium CYA1]MCZ7633290.1 methylenetetrahydrofolate reductase [NAD(P)H] [Phycisphaerales bacterium]MDL1905526.1 methylenetetrahydrofolate reductase [NAD(P)H] [Synechococcales cyanobacterium CNB]GIK18232.1 MAG: methylenetetrahydrofolate reductase [Planctomycetota bacterium]